MHVVIYIYIYIYLCALSCNDFGLQTFNMVLSYKILLSDVCLMYVIPCIDYMLALCLGLSKSCKTKRDVMRNLAHQRIRSYYTSVRHFVPNAHTQYAPHTHSYYLVQCLHVNMTVNSLVATIIKVELTLTLNITPPG